MGRRCSPDRRAARACGADQRPVPECARGTGKSCRAYRGPGRPGYYPETDSLYIDLSEKTGSKSVEVSEGVVLDYDADGKLVGIDIDNATNKVELKKLILSKLPGKIETAAA